MASAVASSVVAPVALGAASPAATASRDSASVKAFSGLKAATLFSSKAQQLSSVHNGSRVHCMQVRRRASIHILAQLVLRASMVLQMLIGGIDHGNGRKWGEADIEMWGMEW